MKNKLIKKLFILIALFFLAFNISYAKSGYYDNIWVGKLAEKSNIVYGINDILEIDNGYVAVGPTDTFGDFIPTLYFLDTNGNVKKQIYLNTYSEYLDYLDALRIIEKDNYYYVIFESEIANYYDDDGGDDGDDNEGDGENVIYDNYILKLDRNGNFIEIKNIKTTGLSWGGGYSDVEVILEEDNNYLYLTCNNQDSYLKVNKDNLTGTQIDIDSIPSSDKKIMSTLASAISNYYVMGKYKDGYYVWMKDNYDSNGDYKTSTFGYYANNKIQWTNEIFYYNKFLSEGTVIEYNNLLIFVNYNISMDPILIAINEKGEIIEQNSISDYFPNITDYDYYNFEHIIKGKNGFFITGSYVFETDEELSPLSQIMPYASEGDKGDDDDDDDDNEGDGNKPEIPLYARESQSAPIYFSKIYNIYTKTDGNGYVDVIESAKAGDEVTFTITPEKGYVLGVTKVTDVNGNTIYFTSTTFTMPSSDVTIEVSFLPENPNTSRELSATMILISIIIGGAIGYFLTRDTIRKDDSDIGAY